MPIPSRETSLRLFGAYSSQRHAHASIATPPQRRRCKSRSLWGSRGCMKKKVPVGHSIGKVFTWNRHSIVLLTLLNFDFDLVVFAEIGDLLSRDKTYLRVDATVFDAFPIHGNKIFLGFLDWRYVMLLPTWYDWIDDYVPSLAPYWSLVGALP